MNEGDHLYELACASSSPANQIAGLNQQELVKLMNHTEHLIKLNGKEGGVPTFIIGLCTIVAAERYRKQTS